MTSPPAQLPEPKLYLEDIAIGQRFRSGRHTMVAADMIAFAMAFDPQPFHTDEEAAKTSFFGRLAASGWHTAAITMRLVVDMLPVAGGVIGAGGPLAWPKPVYAGDVLEVEIEVMEATPSRSRPDRGSIVIHILTRNQEGEVVQEFTPRVMLARRTTSTP
jgi:acyl dehydratase